MRSGGASSMLKRAAKKMVLVAACGSFSWRRTVVGPAAIDASGFSISGSQAQSPRKREQISGFSKGAEHTTSNKNICAICLDPLCFSSASSPGQAIFTAQCAHAFHFACISSSVRHGNITCPICRAHWTHLPRNLNIIPCNQNDPILRILDDSIANFRVHRRSFLRSAHYDDDDPVEPGESDTHPYPRLDLSLVPIPPMSAYLSVKLAHQATDLVLVASPNGPHLRLLKQAMALVVFSLRPIDRLAIVAHSSAAARVFPLRRMTSGGKRTALQVIDRVFYMGHADPMEGLEKGIKILQDRSHKNPDCSILHLSDSPTRPHTGAGTGAPAPVPLALLIHRFHVGFSFGTSNGFVMHEFKHFLARLLGGAVQGIQVRIEEDGRIMRLGELRGGQEKRVLLDLRGKEHVRVGFSYMEGGDGGFLRTGEALVRLKGERERNGGGGGEECGGRRSNGEGWDYFDPYMARRWAKHLHGHRL